MACLTKKKRVLLKLFSLKVTFYIIFLDQNHAPPSGQVQKFINSLRDITLPKQKRDFITTL